MTTHGADIALRLSGVRKVLGVTEIMRGALYADIGHVASVTTIFCTTFA